MRAALDLFEQLEIEYVRSNEARRRGPRSTCCGNIVQRLVRKRGAGHVTIVLRTIVESQGNESELVADVIGAISDLIRAHPRWVGLGLQWLEAFDQISLAEVRKTAKATGVRPLRNAIMTLLCLELDVILGPSKRPKPPKPVKVKREPTLPISVTRIPGVEASIDVGVKLLALRATTPGNCQFGRLVRARFDIDQLRATEAMRVARVYADRPEIYRRLSWQALLDLASPSIPAAVRQQLEAVITPGNPITGPDIRRIRKSHAAPTASAADRSITSTASPMLMARLNSE
jgi:hypothetical protein